MSALLSLDISQNIGELAASLSADFPARLVAFWRHEYSSKVQQRPRYSALSSGVQPHSARLNDAEREPCRHFASKGLGVRVPLAPPCVMSRDIVHS
jgi:hypothetical protein